MGGKHYQSVGAGSYLKCWRVRVKATGALLGCVHWRTRLAASIDARSPVSDTDRQQRLTLAPASRHWSECTHRGIVDPH